MEEKQIKFESWALVELFGHNQLAGLVTEQVIAGQSFVRIDVPKTKLTPAFTKYQLPTSIYGITPVEQNYAEMYAEKLNVQPISTYQHEAVISELLKMKVAQMHKQLDQPFD